MNRVATATDWTSRVIAYGYVLDCVVQSQADPDGTVAASAVGCPEGRGDRLNRLTGTNSSGPVASAFNALAYSDQRHKVRRRAL